MKFKFLAPTNVIAIKKEQHSREKSPSEAMKNAYLGLTEK